MGKTIAEKVFERKTGFPVKAGDLVIAQLIWRWDKMGPHHWQSSLLKKWVVKSIRPISYRYLSLTIMPQAN